MRSPKCYAAMLTPGTAASMTPAKARRYAAAVGAPGSVCAIPVQAETGLRPWVPKISKHLTEHPGC